MRIALIVVGLLVSLVAQPQEIYRWVDKNGIVHYEDQPRSPDAKLIEYIGLGYEGGADDSPPLYTPEPQQQPERPLYQVLSIISPTPEQVFYGGDVSVNVEVGLDAVLRDEDELLIFVDGNRAPNVGGLSATITGLSRGTHFLRAAVMNPAGTVVITSPQITFHIRQASITAPPTGPNLRPPPPPPSPPPSRPGS